MTKMRSRKTRRSRSQELVKAWWNFDDRETNYDWDAHKASLLMSDTPMSQMDELQGEER